MTLADSAELLVAGLTERERRASGLRLTMATEVLQALEDRGIVRMR